jgi:flagellar biosynthesis/type III secretory pathway ATPase
MVNIGAYRKGGSEQFDSALEAMPLVREFMAQKAFDRPDKEISQTLEAMLELCERIDCDDESTGAYIPEMTLHG